MMKTGFFCLIMAAGTFLWAADSAPVNKIVSKADPATIVTPVGSLGKDAVISKLKAMFQKNNKPIIRTKKFIPEKPYLKVEEIKNDASGGPARVIIVYRFRFVSAEKAIDSVETALGDAGTVEVSSTQNTIVINVLKSHSTAIQKMLLSLDVPLPQVMVETQIVEVQISSGESRDVGMTYTDTDSSGNKSTYGYKVTSPSQKSSSSSGSAGINFFPISGGSEDGANYSFNIMLNWLNSSSDAKLLASPTVIADLGTEARMETGEDLPYTENSVTNSAVTQSIKFKRTGVKLLIKPTLINNDTVQLEINPQVTMAVSYTKFEIPSSSGGDPTTNNIPVVSVRNIKTSLTAADGEIIMLGGLYASEISSDLSKVPYLSSIPLLGEAFSAKEATIKDKQLIFFMKVHILKTPYSTVLDPEETALTTRKIEQAISTSPIIFQKNEMPQLTTVDDPEKTEREHNRKKLPNNGSQGVGKLQGRVKHVNMKELPVPVKEENSKDETKKEQEKQPASTSPAPAEKTEKK